MDGIDEADVAHRTVRKRSRRSAEDLPGNLEGWDRPARTDYREGSRWGGLIWGFGGFPVRSGNGSDVLSAEMDPAKIAALLLLCARVQGGQEARVDDRQALQSSIASQDFRSPPPCSATRALSTGQGSPLLSPNFPGFSPPGFSCSWEFRCPVDMTLQCSTFQLPSSNFCWQSALTYNRKRVCGSSPELRSPVNVGKDLKVEFFSIRSVGFNCTVNCGTVPAPPPPPPCRCGVSQISNGALDAAKNQTQPGAGQVIGGSGVLSQRKYPWIAWIGTSASRVSKCGGSLINDRYVLTSASCIDPSYQTYIVTLGDFNRSTWSDSHSIQIPASAIIHPQFNSSNRNNDIALLKLKIPVDFNAFPHIRPVCLSSSAIPAPSQTVTVVGWSGTGVPHVLPENVLKEATMKVISQETCKASHPVHTTNSTICVQPVDKNSCSGDFGGPVLYQTPSGYYQEVGINSYKNGECLPNSGIVATKTANYVDNFIKSNTQDAQWCPAP
ncbi:unnamed protein product [Darwinula stevensoni]|uniref:Peptidase S1 domain-containing protein n=2 Tax=Darwinula stevensoni TaxID=69355 RepID=A0A7R9ABD8_9CRUS|nr:unnamed protein product [Darwinula stevensoni]CAG0898874.1 unnamed protein product [Darwinula stevensoni]